MTVQVPEQLLIANNVKFDLKDASGSLIGNATVDKNTEKISIVFTYCDEIDQQQKRLFYSIDVLEQGYSFLK